MPRNRTTSPMSPPRSCCRSSKRATVLSFSSFGRDIGEVVLLRGIGYLGPGGGRGAGLAVIAARGSSERNLGGGHGRLNFLRQGYTARASGRVVDYDRRRAGAV